MGASMRAAQQTTVALLAVGAVALGQRDIDECTDYAMEVYSTLAAVPTPEDSLYSFLAEQTQLATVTELCQVPQVTGSLAGEYTRTSAPSPAGWTRTAASSRASSRLAAT